MLAPVVPGALEGAWHAGALEAEKTNARPGRRAFERTTYLEAQMVTDDVARRELIKRLTRALEALADGEHDLCGDIVADILVELEQADRGRG